MKRFSIAVLLLLATAGVLYGATAITVNPSEMKNGETKTLVDGRNTITVRRDGDDVNIKIEGGGTTQSLTITRSGDKFRVERERIIMPPRILLDDTMPRFKEKKLLGQTWFVCPKDHTMLRVPAGKEDQTYKCPVDGTTMEKRETHGFSFFFDDSDFDGESL